MKNIITAAIFEGCNRDEIRSSYGDSGKEENLKLSEYVHMFVDWCKYLIFPNQSIYTT